MKYPEDPILIIDDEEHFLEMAKIALRMAGINNTVTCSDSRKANSYLQSQTYSLVLLDLTMPYVSGTEILGYINENFPRLPVIIITASTEFEAAAGCVGRGVHDYLLKPVDKVSLIACIQRALCVQNPNTGMLVRELLLSDRLDISPEDCRCSNGLCNCSLLKKVREAYQSLFNDMHIPMFITSAEDYTVMYCNKSLADFLGFPDPNKLIERKISLITFLAEPEKLKLADTLRASKSLANYELRGSNARGEEFWILLNARTDEAGRYIEGSFIDITHKKRLEEQLLQAQKMEALGRMAGGVAHDFNNILAVINGYTEMLLLDERLPQEVSSGLREIQKAYQRATDMTQQLLSFGRRQSKRPEPAHLHSIIKDSEKMLLRLIRKDVALRIETKAASDYVAIAPGQTEQVLINLVVNAQDAMPEGGRIDIETNNFTVIPQTGDERNELIPGDYLWVRVSDTGCGMDTETQKKIFEPFFTAKQEKRGTGLGLSTVFSIVKNCGGSIFVASAVGRGSQFNLYFPLQHQEIKEEQEAVLCR